MSETKNNMTLAILLADMELVQPEWDREIIGIALDSRQVKPGFLFMACVGTQIDAREYIDEAIQNGAVAIVAEEGLAAGPQGEQQIPVFPVNHLNQKIAKIAARFYGQPSRHLRIIGITGTNGKTSCCHFLAAALNQGAERSALIGTLGYGPYDNIHSQAINTTPDAVSLQRLFSEFHAESINSVVMEVSSHALSQGRVNNIEFDIAVFTNLSQDHLDYHGDMQSYGAAKEQLFQGVGLKHAVINIDDAFGRELVGKLPENVNCLTYAIDNTDALVRVKKFHLSSDGISASVNTPWGEAELQSSLLGRFNLLNILAVITTLGALEYSLSDIVQRISLLPQINGRMQCVGGGEKALIVIDYAHTPDALQKALQALREHSQGQLWCVFGCGGDRDKTKRPLMAQKAEQFADHIVITDDNPRTEDPKEITQDILSGFEDVSKIIVEHDRQQAIESVLAQAQKNDIVLIAGKGHEEYQIIGTEKIPFSDVAVVESCSR